MDEDKVDELVEKLDEVCGSVGLVGSVLSNLSVIPYINENTRTTNNITTISL
jgi:hypothetical protein